MVRVIGTFTVSEPRTPDEKQLAGQQGVTFVRDDEGRSWYEVVEGLQRRKGGDYAHYGVVALGKVRVANTDPTALFPAWSDDGGRPVPAVVIASADPVLAGTNYEDGAFQPPDPDPVPSVVSMAQARVALRRIDLLDQVEAVIASLPDAERAEAELAWEYAPTLSRNGAFVTELAPALGLDDAALDALFGSAAAITL